MRIRSIALVAFCSLLVSAAWAQSRPRDGACFYVDINFRGDSFCANVGDSVANMPSGFNDRVRSIQVFGRAEVVFFNDNDFMGGMNRTRENIPDLRALPLADDPAKNWTTRISSLKVNDIGGGRDRWDDNRGRDWDRDNNRGGRWYEADDAPQVNTLDCAAGMNQNRQWCGFGTRIYRVRIVNERGSRPCEWKRTFGIENGRLWTSRGCAATFEVR